MRQKTNLRQLLEDEFSACADALAESHQYIEIFWENPDEIELAVRAHHVAERKAELPCQGTPLEEYLYGEMFNKIKPDLELRHYGFANAPVLRPAISLYPDLSLTHFMAVLMGAQIIRPEGVGETEQSSWCRPLLSSPAEVDKITGLDVLSHPSFVAYLKDLASVREITGGAIPIEIMAGIGPVDVAADLLGYQGFLEGLYTHPQEMHKIVELCSNYWLEVVQAQMQTAGWTKNKWATPGMPASEMISPQVSLGQIREFFMPVRRCIAEKFGKCSATMSHPDVRALDLWMELDGCKVCSFAADCEWSADYVVPRMRGKAVASFYLNHNPRHLPCPTWEEHLVRFRTFAGRMKMLVTLTGITPPRAEARALQHLQNLQDVSLLHKPCLRSE